MITNIKDIKSKEDLLDVLYKYLKDNIELSQREMEAKDKFNLPAWGEHQAYQLGMIKSYRKLVTLILTGSNT